MHKALSLKAEALPSKLGYRMPAEWAPHEATWLTWPQNQETWPGHRLEKVRRTYTQMIEALLSSETVHLLVQDAREEAEVADGLKQSGINIQNLVFHQAKTVDTWIRDYGPTFVAGEGKKAWCKWIFNAWGGKYPDLARDDEVFRKREQAASPGIATCPLFQYPCFEVPVVLEGGSIEVNGQGTIMTTEQCLLNENRNPQLTREEIEKILCDHLGAQQVLWLGDGIAGDDTDGHVDDITRFVGPNTIATVFEEDRDDPNYRPLLANWNRLLGSGDPKGRKWNLVKLPMPAPVVDEGVRLPASYANFYIANEVVLVPVYEDPHDKRAMNIFKELFPKRVVEAVPCRELVYGLGSIHCVTQQEPK